MQKTDFEVLNYLNNGQPIKETTDKQLLAEADELIAKMKAETKDKEWLSLYNDLLFHPVASFRMGD